MSTSPLVGMLSPAEERFEAWRGRVGFVLAPAAALGIALLELPSLTPEAHRLASVMVAVVVLWITESLPMPVTALLGASACVI
ncbi:MAG: anion permease, partial [Gemmatimonadales bacterium]|nr:anion permease [Gemmatimonadales bacterium]